MKQNYLAILALLFYVIFARDISHAIFNEKQSLYSNLWLSPIRIHYRLPLCLHGYKIQSFEIDRTSLHSSLSLLAIARRDETSDFFSSTINHNHHSSNDCQLTESLKGKWRKILLHICAEAIATARQTIYISKKRRQYCYRRI